MEPIPFEPLDSILIQDAFDLCLMLLRVEGGKEIAADHGFNYTKAQLEEFWATFEAAADENGESDLYDMEMVQAVVKMVVTMLRENGDEDKFRTFKALLTKIESYAFEIPDDSPIH
jgi:hypothetical protein